MMKKNMIEISRNQDESMICIKGKSGHKKSAEGVISLGVNEKAKKYLTEKQGNMLIVSCNKFSKDKLSHYVPGETKLRITIAEEILPHTTIKEILLVQDVLDPKHELAAFVSKFWTSPKSKLPKLMFKITIDPIKKRKSKLNANKQNQ